MDEKPLPAPVAEKVVDDSISIEAHAIEQRIPIAKINHLLQVHQLERSAKVSPERFAELLDLTSKARV
jgi:hypothetical protein